MEYSSVGILLTENCNAKCKMCCDSRGEVKGKTLSLSEINTILENIKECKEINSIGITGGEPLLYPDLVEYILNFDYGRPLNFTIKTNGFWGNNKEKARDFINKNKNKINSLSFSYDEFHKEFIDIDNIKNLIDIANEYNIKTEIIGCFLKSGVNPGDILNELGDYAYVTNFHYQPVINTGSAKNFHDSEFIKLLNSDNHEIRCFAPCESQLLINPNLTVYPCCSQVIENTILEVGNLRNDSLNSIISSIKHNQIFYTIFTKGFTPFIDFMKKNNIKYEKQLSSPCEVCASLFETDWFLKELFSRNFYENV